MTRSLRVVPPPTTTLSAPESVDPVARLQDALGWAPTPEAIRLVAGWSPDDPGLLRLLEAMERAS